MTFDIYIVCTHNLRLCKIPDGALDDARANSLCLIFTGIFSAC